MRRTERYVHLVLQGLECEIQIETLRRERHTPVIRLCLKFITIELAILFNSQILNLSVGGRSRELHNQKTQRTLHAGKQKEQKR
jgi:hypothetical protein